MSVRPIEPQGKLIGFASVNFGGVVVDDFKVVNGQNGIFLGVPSKPDPTSRTGYRATVRINDRATQERLNAAGVEAYHSAVEKLIARAEAVRWAVKPSGAVLFFAQCPYDKILGASNLSMLRYEWVWYKSRCTGFLNARRATLKKTENILVFYQRLPSTTRSLNVSVK